LGEASLSEQAYYVMREMIVTALLPPGAIINEPELQRQLQIGRTPIREAVRRLAQEKLLEVVPRRGIFVTNVNIRDLASLGEVRLVMEAHAASLAAQRATEAERAEALELSRELGQKPGTDQRAAIELDRRIHNYVYRCAHNQFLAETLESYYTLALRIWFLGLGRMKDVNLAREHRALLAAIRRGDRAGAERAMRDHINTFQRALRDTL
jgi:DNA-binding GntR family transcriptional regulator